MSKEAKPDAVTTPRTRSRLLLPTLVAFSIGGLVLIVLMLWNPMAQTPPPSSGPIQGTFTVRIISPDEKKQSISVEEAGALPVRAGERMSLDAQFREPVYCWMLWIDTQGNVIPLYPWNDGTIEGKDANAAPPARQPAKVVFNPVNIGSGWEFGKGDGLDTVLLLARRTRPERTVPLGDLLKGMPPMPMRSPNEVVGLRLDRGQSAAAATFGKERGSEAQTRERDGPLLERIERLREQFDTIWVVRFAHSGP